MTDAFFRSSSPGTFEATALTRGPWSNDHQHGGPPAALLGGALEAFGADAADFFVARLSIELYRPIPITTLTVKTELTRPGKQVQRLEARLFDGTTEVARALGLRIRKRDLALPPLEVARPSDAPGDAPVFEFPFFQHDIGYHRAVEVRITKGRWAEGPLVAWMRPVVPLVAGRASTALERVLIVVDAESGVCPPLDVKAFTFVNPDLTLYLERELEGEWIRLDVRSSASSRGVGLAESSLADGRGTFGRAAQSLVVAAR